jgi:cobalt-zinc-cadmium efflux system membrane fusion protein
MFAKVWVESGTAEISIIVPDSAVQRAAGKSVVFVYHPIAKGGGRFERREVQLGSPSKGRVPVTQGLKPGDAVVIAGAYAVKAQMEKGSMPDLEM